MPFRHLQKALQGKIDIKNALTQVAQIFEAYVWSPSNLESDLSALAEDWHEVGTAGEPVFDGTWVNFGGSRDIASFYKDPWGTVYIKGSIKTGAIGTNCFTLPEDYRPIKELHFAVNSNDAFGSLRITSSGAVRPRVGSPTEFSINCNFRAA